MYAADRAEQCQRDDDRTDDARGLRQLRGEELARVAATLPDTASVFDMYGNRS